MPYKSGVRPPAMLLAQKCRQYGVTPVWFLYQYHLQGGVCAICKQPEKRTKYRGGTLHRPFHMNIDHDHATGAVRQLLCHRCNKLVGYLEAPDSWRHQAYVEMHSAQGTDV